MPSPSKEHLYALHHRSGGEHSIVTQHLNSWLIKRFLFAGVEAEKGVEERSGGYGGGHGGGYEGGQQGGGRGANYPDSEGFQKQY